MFPVVICYNAVIQIISMLTEQNKDIIRLCLYVCVPFCTITLNSIKARITKFGTRSDLDAPCCRCRFVCKRSRLRGQRSRSQVRKWLGHE